MFAGLLDPQHDPRPNHQRKRNLLLHLAGAGVVAFWLVVVGILVRDVHFGNGGSPTAPGGSPDKPRIDSAQREWKEIFLKDRKVGYSVNLIVDVIYAYVDPRIRYD